MLTRIVKLTLKAENISSFEALFKENQHRIKGFPGCLSLELYQDIGEPTIFFTYSTWEDEARLNAYRDSDFFKSIWPRTKSLFQDKAQAWSLMSKT